MNDSLERLAVARGQTASLKYFINSNPKLAMTSMLEYGPNIDKSLHEKEYTFLQFNVKFCDTKDMIEMVERTTVLHAKKVSDIHAYIPYGTV